MGRRRVFWLGLEFSQLLFCPLFPPTTALLPARDCGCLDFRFGPWFRQWFEHFAAFAMVAGMFAIGYRFSLIRLLLLAFFFCGGIELLQVPLPTRHARVSDFVIDFVASSFAIAVVFVSDNLAGRNRQ